MGYNGDVEVYKRNPQHYRKSAEEQQEFFKEKARQKYNDKTVIIHTGTESPEDSIDPDDGKVHVWVNPDGVQEITKEDGITVDVDDPNIKIFNSKEINNTTEQEAILEVILYSEEFKQYRDLYEQDSYKRGMPSYLKEWKAHNLMYEVGELGEGAIEGLLELPLEGNFGDEIKKRYNEVEDEWIKKIVDFADIKDRAKSVDLNKVDKNAWMYDKNMIKRYNEEKNK